MDTHVYRHDELELLNHTSSLKWRHLSTHLFILEQHQLLL